MAEKALPDSSTEWVVHGERTLYESRWLSLNLVDVTPPVGERFEHHVVRMQRVAVTAILEPRRDALLMIKRHRFIDQSWGWEVPVGIVEPGEDSEQTARREVEEETGWRPGSLEHVLTFQPAIGIADSPHDLYAGSSAEHIGAPTDQTEAAKVDWIPMARVRGMVADGEVRDAASLVAALHALAYAQPRSSRTRLS